MGEELKSSAQRVQAALRAQGVDLKVREFPAGTRTAQDAATAIGCAVAQIAKSLIFRGKSSDASVLVVASGANQVDEKKVAGLLGEKIGRADAQFVRAKTGFAIGGVPPLGHLEPPRVLLDEELLALGEIWAAAGTPQAVFALRAEDLPRLTGGVFADVKKT
jgi:prolyl-tRNA editing enzyme YbaK/EbsC (Cys-tRNA(Pro) deacylase)|tara:strand:+ start:66 stop:551 length:486 start_codon:yes stop_codon:yes gene_type:complete